MIYLASESPRRAELLQQLGVAFERLRVDVDESARPDEDAAGLVRRLAQDKAAAGARQVPGQGIVLGADTLVVLDGQALGKPADREAALAMLQRLSGREHEVLSAVALQQDSSRAVRISRTRVRFRELTPGECVAYWDTGEPRDKAGAYAIQGLGAIFVERLEGSYSGVMGLPLYETAQLLAAFAHPVFPGDEQQSQYNRKA